MPPLIELREISKSYHRDAIEIPVLDRVTISVAEGDFLGLMGPSGSGKSTLLNLLAGIDRPTRGMLTIGGTDIGSLGERALAAWRARHIGFIFHARAIVTDPTLLLADEPTGDLDARSAGEVLTLLQRLNQEFKKTIVMVTHDPHAAERASHVLHLEKGTLVEQTRVAGVGEVGSVG